MLLSGNKLNYKAIKTQIVNDHLTPYLYCYLLFVFDLTITSIAKNHVAQSTDVRVHDPVLIQAGRHVLYIPYGQRNSGKIIQRHEIMAGGEARICHATSMDIQDYPEV